MHFLFLIVYPNTIYLHLILPSPRLFFPEIFALCVQRWFLLDIISPKLSLTYNQAIAALPSGCHTVLFFVTTLEGLKSKNTFHQLCLCPAQPLSCTRKSISISNLSLTCILFSHVGPVCEAHSQSMFGLHLNLLDTFQLLQTKFGINLTLLQTVLLCFHTESKARLTHRQDH